MSFVRYIIGQYLKWKFPARLYLEYFERGRVLKTSSSSISSLLDGMLNISILYFQVLLNIFHFGFIYIPLHFRPHSCEVGARDISSGNFISDFLEIIWSLPKLFSYDHCHNYLDFWNHMITAKTILTSWKSCDHCQNYLDWFWKSDIDCQSYFSLFTNCCIAHMLDLAKTTRPFWWKFLWGREMGVMGGVRRRCDTVTAFMFLPKDQPDPRRGRGGAALTPINNTLSCHHHFLFGVWADM